MWVYQKNCWRGLPCWFFCFVLNAPVLAEKSNDDFILGYATAIVAEYFPSDVKTIRVDNGTVYLEDISLSETNKNSDGDGVKKDGREDALGSFPNESGG